MKHFCIEAEGPVSKKLSKTGWSDVSTRLIQVEKSNCLSVGDALEKLHNRKVFACKLLKKRDLQSQDSE